MKKAWTRKVLMSSASANAPPFLACGFAAVTSPPGVPAGGFPPTSAPSIGGGLSATCGVACSGSGVGSVVMGCPVVSVGRFSEPGRGEGPEDMRSGLLRLSSLLGLLYGASSRDRLPPLPDPRPLPTALPEVIELGAPDTTSGDDLDPEVVSVARSEEHTSEIQSHHALV